MKGRAHSWLWGLAGLLVFALVAAGLYRGWHLLHPLADRLAPLDPSCDLRSGPCQVRFDDGSEARLGIEPRTIPVARPLTLTVSVHRLDVDGVEVDFAGTDMDMGFNRVALIRQGTDLFRGEAMLPLCVRQRMQWEAKVILHTPEGRWIAPFRFETRQR